MSLSVIIPKNVFVKRRQKKGNLFMKRHFNAEQTHIGYSKRIIQLNSSKKFWADAGWVS